MPLPRRPSQEPHDPVRTFHPRANRIGDQRREALERLFPRFGVEVHDSTAPHSTAMWWDTAALFGRDAPVVLEIGSGMGAATVAAASADPDRDVLAVEVHIAGVAALLAGIERAGLSNIRVAYGDAMDLVRESLAPDSLDEVRAYFPDPWPKARHHKRRLISPDHVAVLVSRLRPGGLVHTATDWPQYAVRMRQVLDAEPQLIREDEDRAGRPVTSFERKGLQAGRAPIDLRYRRIR